MRLGGTLKRRRQELGLTLGDLGARLGLANGNFIGMVERGERMPGDARLKQLAEVLELDARALFALKYEDSRATAAGVLLAPPEPTLPRLRATLLDLCGNPDAMRAEWERGERTALERIVFGLLVEYVFLPALTGDRFAPRQLRDRVLRAARKGDEVDPWWFEEEHDRLGPWMRQVLSAWSFDLPTLTLQIQHSDDPGDRSTIPLIDREVQQRMIAASPPASLDAALRAEGLDDADIDEIRALVAWKVARKARDDAG